MTFNSISAVGASSYTGTSGASHVTKEEVQAYAQEYGITIQQAAQKLGAPPPPPKAQQQGESPSIYGTQGANGSQPPSKEEMLASYNIPADVIAQGDEAIEEYAAENGITLPPKPSKGGNLNFMS